ncbi:hypothetical protein CR513_28204, partial [Mucuna pruriens]
MWIHGKVKSASHNDRRGRAIVFHRRSPESFLMLGWIWMDGTMSVSRVGYRSRSRHIDLTTGGRVGMWRQSQLEEGLILHCQCFLDDPIVIGYLVSDQVHVMEQCFVVLLHFLGRPLRKSDIAWKDAKYAQIWEYLRDEFELTQRFASLDFKLKFVEHNIRFLQEILQNRKSDFLEWLIIALIGAEILLSLYDILQRFRKIIANESLTFIILELIFTRDALLAVWLAAKLFDL